MFYLDALFAADINGTASNVPSPRVFIYFWGHRDGGGFEGGLVEGGLINFSPKGQNLFNFCYI